jgi:hypothetical protein
VILTAIGGGLAVGVTYSVIQRGKRNSANANYKTKPPVTFKQLKSYL